MNDAPPLKLRIDGSVYLGRRNRLRGLGVYTRELVQGLLGIAPGLDARIIDPIRGREVPACADPDIEPVSSELLEWDRRPGHWIYEAAQTLHYLERGMRPGEVLLFTGHDALPWIMPVGSVVVVHDLISSCWGPLAGRRKLGWLRDRMAGWQAGQAARLATDSESTRQDVLRVWEVPPDQASVTWNVFLPPVVPATEPPPEVARFLDDPRPFLLFLGAREPRKGLRELLARWEGRRERDVRLLVVAPSVVYDPEIEERSGRLRGREDFQELLDLSDDERTRVLARATCLVFPTRYEGFGRPVAEAMLVGTPVVTFANSSLPEVCGEAGEVLPDGDFEALLAAALRLARDPSARAEASRRARARAPAFDWRRTAGRFLDVIEEVAAENWGAVEVPERATT